ncbi:hypothetical protein PCE1_002378 [Barthelona sp. PCE]
MKKEQQDGTKGDDEFSMNIKVRSHIQNLNGESCNISVVCAGHGITDETEDILVEPEAFFDNTHTFSAFPKYTSNVFAAIDTLTLNLSLTTDLQASSTPVTTPTAGKRTGKDKKGSKGDRLSIFQEDISIDFILCNIKRREFSFRVETQNFVGSIDVCIICNEFVPSDELLRVRPVGLVLNQIEGLHQMVENCKHPFIRLVGPSGFIQRDYSPNMFLMLTLEDMKPADLLQYTREGVIRIEVHSLDRKRRGVEDSEYKIKISSLEEYETYLKAKQPDQFCYVDVPLCEFQNVNTNSINVSVLPGSFERFFVEDIRNEVRTHVLMQLREKDKPVAKKDKKGKKQQPVQEQVERPKSSFAFVENEVKRLCEELSQTVVSFANYDTSLDFDFVLPFRPADLTNEEYVMFGRLFFIMDYNECRLLELVLDWITDQNAESLDCSIAMLTAAKLTADQKTSGVSIVTGFHVTDKKVRYLMLEAPQVILTELLEDLDEMIKQVRADFGLHEYSRVVLIEPRTIYNSKLAWRHRLFPDRDLSFHPLVLKTDIFTMVKGMNVHFDHLCFSALGKLLVLLKVRNLLQVDTSQCFLTSAELETLERYCGGSVSEADIIGQEWETLVAHNPPEEIKVTKEEAKKRVVEARRRARSRLDHDNTEYANTIYYRAFSTPHDFITENILNVATHGKTKRQIIRDRMPAHVLAALEEEAARGHVYSGMTSTGYLNELASMDIEELSKGRPKEEVGEKKKPNFVTYTVRSTVEKRRLKNDLSDYRKAELNEPWDEPKLKVHSDAHKGKPFLTRVKCDDYFGGKDEMKSVFIDSQNVEKKEQVQSPMQIHDKPFMGCGNPPKNGPLLWDKPQKKGLTIIKGKPAIDEAELQKSIHIENSYSIYDVYPELLFARPVYEENDKGESFDTTIVFNKTKSYMK